MWWRPYRVRPTLPWPRSNKKIAQLKALSLERARQEEERKACERQVAKQRAREEEMEIIRPSFRHCLSLHSVTHISCPPAYPIAPYDLSRFHPNSVYKLSTRFKRTPCLTQTLPVSVPLLKSPSPTLLLNALTPEIMTLTTIQVILILLTTPQ